ncbi:MAG: hypothetical protein GEU75_04605 [Dehalococcoidia bacterium]|nr:hypothetical protein [Dehalococcoidia bacterium]
MRVLLLLLLLAGLAILPFAMLRQPWALRIWRRLRMAILVYVVVIVVAAVVALVFRWDEIYG